MYREEILYDNPLLSLKVFQVNHRNYQEESGPWHYHEELEILVILNGYLDIYINHSLETLTPGEVLVIGPSELHTDRPCSDFISYIVFQFDVKKFIDPSILPYEQFFYDPSFPLSRLNSTYRNNPMIRDQIAVTVKEIYKESQSKNEGYEIAIGMLIRKIMLVLFRNSPPKEKKNNFDPEYTRLRPALQYVERNLKGKIAVNEASKLVNMSYYYFVKTFKRVMGISFVNYVNQLRIKNAEKLLLTQDLSVSAIAEETGIDSSVHFYRLFRKYNGCSPHVYRKKMQALSQNQSNGPVQE
jgi:AraC-like DNA-binding protein